MEHEGVSDWSVEEWGEHETFLLAVLLLMGSVLSQIPTVLLNDSQQEEECLQAKKHQRFRSIPMRAVCTEE